MAIELKVPEVGESITEVMVASWLVKEGEHVELDQPVAELESDKATVELPAPEAGKLTKILVGEGEYADVGKVIGEMEAGAGGDKTAAKEEKKESTPEKDEGEEKAQQPSKDSGEAESDSGGITPSARRLLEEKGLEAGSIKGTGKGGMILKEDVEKAASQQGVQPQPQAAPDATGEFEQPEEDVTMSPIRRTIARRLLESQQSTAQLTTFQEIDMGAVMELRSQYKQKFQDKNGIKLGFMSFFIKAAVEALKEWPTVNAEIRGDRIIYKNYYNIGIAVGGGKGLVVPVIRNAERLSFAQLEQQVNDFAKRAADNKISLDELEGGTFTISNGGVYGSMLSTPILNPPQSGVLGLHAIKERPAAVDGEVVVRPVMYLALTYDHRMVDGRESVGFLMRIKETIEEPARILLEV